ncbi:MAG: hypothetical protein IKF36_04620 [Bacilli bacterium]|nr:hypothetical protein [Bacilli bacterium]
MEKSNKKKRSYKKIAIVTTSVGVIALAPVSPFIPIGAATVALWTAPAFVYGSNVQKECAKDEKMKKMVLKK